MFLNEHQSVQHQLFRIKFTELNEIFMIMSLRSFVISMIGIFVPIYLYTMGYSLRYIILLEIIQFVVEAFFEILALKLNIKWGPKHTIALSMPFLILNFFLLRTLPDYNWPIWLIGASAGICLAFYWQAYHYDFSRSKHKKASTKDVSKLYVILAVLGAIAPFIGGVIASRFGIKTLFTFVILLLIMVLIPLLKDGEKVTQHKINFSRIKIKNIYRDIISYGGSGIEASASLKMWPLFIFLILGSYEKVGFVTSLALIITIVVTYYIGKSVNNINRHRFIKFSSITNSIIYILQTFVDSFGQVMSINIARSFTHSIHAAPFVSEYYLHADENSRAEYIYLMELSIDIFRLFAYLVLLGLTYVFADKQVIIAALLMGSVGSLMTGLMPKARCETKDCENASLKVVRKIS
jgi:hypothetical protein